MFTGNVHVRAESQGDLRADHATVEITSGQLASAFVSGSPAQFEQTRSKQGSPARGHASTVDYNVAAGTVKLTGDALLNMGEGQNVLKAPSITYNVRSQEIQGDSGSGGSAHLSITPRPGAGPPEGKP